MAAGQPAAGGADAAEPSPRRRATLGSAAAAPSPPARERSHSSPQPGRLDPSWRPPPRPQRAPSLHSCPGSGGEPPRRASRGSSDEGAAAGRGDCAQEAAHAPAAAAGRADSSTGSLGGAGGPPPRPEHEPATEDSRCMPEEDLEPGDPPALLALRSFYARVNPGGGGAARGDQVWEAYKDHPDVLMGRLRERYFPLDPLLPPELGPLAELARRGWDCPACTLLNPIEAPVCGACGSRRPPPPAAPAPAPAGAAQQQQQPWACSVCTLHNEAAMDNCAACGAPRPSGAAAARRQPSGRPRQREDPGRLESLTAPAAPAGTAGDSEEWCCERCTLSNAAKDYLCAACGAERPPLTPVSARDLTPTTSEAGRSFADAEVREGVRLLANASPRQRSRGLSMLAARAGGPSSGATATGGGSGGGRRPASGTGRAFEDFVVSRRFHGMVHRRGTPATPRQFQVVECWPRSKEEVLREYPKMLHFCFGDDHEDSHGAPTHGVAVRFTFVLTDRRGGWMYGFCLRPHAGQGECLCVLSKHPWFGLFYELLGYAMMQRLQGKPPTIVKALMSLSPVPEPGERFRLGDFSLTRPDDTFPLLDAGVAELLERFGVQCTLELFAALLEERRVLLVGTDLDNMTTCGHALLSLLYPFRWHHPFVPVLPQEMLDALCSPTPFLMGVHQGQMRKVDSLPCCELVVARCDSPARVEGLSRDRAVLPHRQQLSDRLEGLLARHRSKRCNLSGHEKAYELLLCFVDWFVATFSGLRDFVKAAHPDHPESGSTVDDEAYIRTLQHQSPRRSEAATHAKFIQAMRATQMFATWKNDGMVGSPRAAPGRDTYAERAGYSPVPVSPLEGGRI
eukprot:TRINITY_DN1783_c2_g1_i1.p1 TRINITY_DN1783_c2_g1~~TRINITY_DN1783_c2_g1_i1.p1  ORF type:complete len:874 (+),score=213.16 TRINITY_DN1783_c2_g1_i1:71-2623(+)